MKIILIAFPSLCLLFFIGGGRDLATAASFGKQNTQSNPLINSQSISSAKAATFDLTSNAIGTASNQSQPVLKHLIPAESILKPFLPKVNTASTRVHPPSTTTNITAASNAAMAYTNASGYGAGGVKMQQPPQGKCNFQIIFLIIRVMSESKSLRSLENHHIFTGFMKQSYEKRSIVSDLFSLIKINWH